jgi:hypothetical protein
MQSYRVYNKSGVIVTVSDADLDEAARGAGELSTELAAAAAMAKRGDLGARLRATLAGPERLQKLAAARALMVARDAEARPLLEQRAADEEDVIAARFFRAAAVRLGGTDAMRREFDRDDGDPDLQRMLVAVYNNYEAPDDGDVDFWIHALRVFLDKERPWVQKEKKDLWTNAVETLVTALGRRLGLDDPCALGLHGT